MAVLDDIATIGLLTASAFFVVLSFALLVRYRQVSQRITTSTDLGRDLWQALEQRMKKQDERILDMMARLEVVQSRVMAASAVRPSLSLPQTPPTAPITQTSLMQAPAESQHTSQPSHESQAPQAVFDETQRTAIQLLRDGPKDTRQLTNALGKSREHTARVMKELFERGLVKRNDATKPFVYQLTAEGSRYLV